MIGTSLTERQQVLADGFQREGLGARKIAKLLDVTYPTVRYYQENRVRPPAPPAGGPKILIWDIETTPLLGYAWKPWKTNLIALKDDWQLLSVSYKWYGQDEVGFLGQWESDRDDDYDIAALIFKLVNEADILVAHNGDRFDMKKAETRFLKHGFGPSAPVRTVDTLKVARSNFGLTYNSLKEITKFLEVEQKKQTSGFQLWLGCMEGDPKYTGEMEEYNRQDVIALEAVYRVLIPWTTTVNMGLYADSDELICSKCGSYNIEKRGFRPTKVGLYQKYRCLDCKGYSSARKREKNVRPVLT